MSGWHKEEMMKEIEDIKGAERDRLGEKIRKAIDGVLIDEGISDESRKRFWAEWWTP